jgi:hypothetical protein
MIYSIGDEFIVDPNSIKDGECNRKMFVGKVTIRNGVVTHLWLRGIGDTCVVGYPVDEIKAVKP